MDYNGWKTQSEFVTYLDPGEIRVVQRRRRRGIKTFTITTSWPATAYLVFGKTNKGDRASSWT